MHQPYRPVPNSQVKEICLNITLKHKANNVCLLGLAVLPSVFLHSTPSFDLSFGWIGDRSVGLDRSATHLKLKSKEDSYFYLSATEGKVFGDEKSNGSFLAHQHANKKKYKNAPYRRFLGEFAK